MSLTVLSVAYPFAPVSVDSAGGAEQVLHALDRALCEAGHDSLVVAATGSHVSGRLLAVPAAFGADEAGLRTAYARHLRAIEQALDRYDVDLVHMHGVDFHNYLPPAGVPVLVTLHLPPGWYPPEALRSERPDTWFHAVSWSQHRDCPDGMRLLRPIENGVPVEALRARHAKRRFALSLGRICPEKGAHLAIDAARRAGAPLLVAGNLSSWEAHRHYFAEEIAPRLDGLRRFIGPLDFRRKRRFLTAARCVLIPSLAPETSSLVTREALACGTPVIAFPNGALPEAIEHGRTGFLVHDIDEMAEAIGAAAALDSEACRQAARTRFSLDTMIARYFALYRSLAAGRAGEGRSDRISDRSEAARWD